MIVRAEARNVDELGKLVVAKCRVARHHPDADLPRGPHLGLAPADLFDDARSLLRGRASWHVATATAVLAPIASSGSRSTPLTSQERQLRTCCTPSRHSLVGGRRGAAGRRAVRRPPAAWGVRPSCFSLRGPDAGGVRRVLHLPGDRRRGLVHPRRPVDGEARGDHDDHHQTVGERGGRPSPEHRPLAATMVDLAQAIKKTVPETDPAPSAARCRGGARAGSTGRRCW